MLRLILAAVVLSLLAPRFACAHDRKEVGGPGDFDNQSPEQLLSYIKGELKELGMDAKTIENTLGVKLEDGNILIPPPDEKSGN